MPNPVPQGYNVFFDIIQLIQDEGTPLPFQPTINFIGAGVIATDDPANNRTNVTIPGGAGAAFYQTIEDEGIALPQQPIFNFIGPIVTAVDDPANNRTNITIAGGGGVDTFMYGFASDGDLSGGPDEHGGWFSDDETSTLLHAQSFVTFAYTIKRGTVHVGTNSSDDVTELAVQINGVINANTLIAVPSSTTGSFDTGAISEAVAINDLTNLNMDRQGSSTFGDYNYHMECER